MNTVSTDDMEMHDVAKKPQTEHDAKWLIIQLRLDPELGPDLDEMRRAEDDLPSRSEMARRCVEREAGRFNKKSKK